MNDLQYTIEKALKGALKSGWIREEDTAVIFYDLDFLRSRLEGLKHIFPASTLHALAIKANPLKRILEFNRVTGMGVEAASMGEVSLALKTGYKPGQIVYDSPVKTYQELEFALKTGIHINIDNLSELDRISKIYPMVNSSSLIGIRINPQVGVGSILESSVAGEYSKFGIPIKTRKKELYTAFETYPWLRGVHLHVGSQGCPMELLINGIGILYDFAMEVNEIRRKKNFPTLDIFDIGGGLPVSYNHAQSPPSMDEYVRAIRHRAPELFSDQVSDSPIHQLTNSPAFRLITEFGRWAFTHAGWTISRVEYVKHDPGISTAMIHVGADLFVRECLNPKDWQHEYSVYDKNGNLKAQDTNCLPDRQGCRIQDTASMIENRKSKIVNQKSYNLAGPLCFSGDILAKGVLLPEIEEGDYIAIHDSGSYTFSMWSRYNSRQAPRILGLQGEKFEILKERETLEEVGGFWK